MHVHAPSEELAARIKAFIAASLRSEDAHTQDSFDTEFNALALDVFALQYQHNLPYQQFCRSRGLRPSAQVLAAFKSSVPEDTTTQVEHWTQIPAVPTCAFKEAEFTCLPPSERTVVFHSSGTTEQRPSRHFHNAQSLALYETSLWPWFVRNVLPEWGGSPAGGERANTCIVTRGLADFGFIALTPRPELAPHSSLVYMFGVLQERLVGGERSVYLPAPGDNHEINRPSGFVGMLAADNSWEVDFAAARIVLESASCSAKPLLIVGTAFSFLHLLDWLADGGLRVALPPGSRVMETGGYKGRSRAIPKAQLHQLITERLGVTSDRIICEYGMSELSSQAYSGKLGLIHPTTSKRSSVHGAETRRKIAAGPAALRSLHFPPWARARVISPETGEEVGDGQTGLLRIVDLANAFSVAALQTEDLAIRRGAGFELIGRAAQAEPRGCSLMATTIAT